VGRWLTKYGRPLAFSIDHDSIFESTSQGEKTRGTTQVSRAAHELGIELILTGSPQAKGRVDRSHGTHQDRWVKLLRLAGAATRAEANELVDRKLLADHNRRFAKPPESPNDAHRSLGPGQNLAAILSIQASRVVSSDSTVRFNNRLYQLHKPALPGLRNGRVIIEQRLDASLAIRFGQRYLDYADLGALPLNPRSLSPGQHPAGSQKDRAPREARPPAVTLTDGCSGRTPAEPYPSAGIDKRTQNMPYRPRTNHPWRRKSPRTKTT
jgi:hypothetical protein